MWRSRPPGADTSGLPDALRLPVSDLAVRLELERGWWDEDDDW